MPRNLCWYISCIIDSNFISLAVGKIIKSFILIWRDFPLIWLGGEKTVPASSHQHISCIISILTEGRPLFFSINSDFLLMVLRDLIYERSDLKLILMSATLNANLFSEYFGECPVVEIPGRYIFFPYRVRLGQTGKCQEVCVKSPPVVTKFRNVL